MNPTTKPEEPADESGDNEAERAVPAAADKNDAPGPSLAKDPGENPEVGAEGAHGDADGAGTASDDGDDGDPLTDDLDGEYTPPPSSGLAAASTALISVLLSLVALIGTWSGRVIAERETLVGQIDLGQTGTAEQQISEIYGDAWHATALTNGIFAVLALIVGLAALGLPQRKSWVRPFAVAGIALGALALLISVGMYFDVFVSLPEPPPAAPPTTG
ncbi:hypothetical protein [Streptomyces niveus]|uniref:Uncharacterized protein n=1 Tax=Streptomyces niveus TaxID=193462 RepID=A0A1U9R2Q1_STRNV|nr:hypothetical protein [Streptomyces niveus]AQU70774.1 hypothetical protein BBN63_09200 [Streptomyces niveus]